MGYLFFSLLFSAYLCLWSKFCIDSILLDLLFFFVNQLCQSLLIGVFSQLLLKVIIDMLGLKSATLLFILCLFPFWFIVFEYITLYSFLRCCYRYHLTHYTYITYLSLMVSVFYQFAWNVEILFPFRSFCLLDFLNIIVLCISSTYSFWWNWKSIMFVFYLSTLLNY